MSSHFELVPACALRRDTPADRLNLLRWYLGLVPGPPAGALDGERLLMPQRDTYLPGGEFAALTDNGGSWGLFYRGFWTAPARHRVPDPHRGRAGRPGPRLRPAAPSRPGRRAAGPRPARRDLAADHLGPGPFPPARRGR
ncbi:hypothetical protein [Actinocorallia longicatena]|uniref:Uncharacterized protein n=1 Tax=Actinocorallia longicatena TaxID=111803 RepID=A0ABP6Q8N7_9ACTN